MALLVGLVGVAVALIVVGNVAEPRIRRNRRPTNVDNLGPLAPSGAGEPLSPGVRLSGSAVWFLVCTAVYLAVACYLVLDRGSIAVDAESRVAQAWYVVASRDPHLAAIGFVWNPLPSLAAIPLVMARELWPALTQRAFAGSIVSSLSMAGAVVQFRAALREMSARRGVAVALTICFAFNPMTVYYGANGMSEAMYLLFLVGATRYLLSWTVAGKLRDLVLTAANLALGYMTRYETLAGAAAAIAVVLIVGTSARSRTRPRSERRTAAVGDALVLAFPVVVAFVGWALTSWLITGQPFQQFTSQYGNSSQISSAVGLASANGTGWPKIVLALVQIWSYAPLLPVLGIVVIVAAVRRRDRRFLALGVLLAPLAFSASAYTGGFIFGWLRFYLPVLPLFLLAVALLLSPLPSMRPASPPWLRRSAFAAVAVSLLVGLPGVAGSTLAMSNAHLGPGEEPQLAWLFRPARSPAEKQEQTWLASAVSISRQIDSLGLPNGSVAVDTATWCASLIVMNSSRPHQFVITSDRDFQEVTADPVAFSVPYVLVPDGSGEGVSNIEVAHPGIFAGGQVGDLLTSVTHQYQTAGCITFRLIRILSDQP